MPKRADIFGSVPVGKVGRTNFNLSHQLTGNFKEGICYPIFVEETLPGDSWRINTYNISKLETLLAPAMQRTNASLLWFKCPKRLLMKNFKKWYTGGTSGDADISKPYTSIQSFVDWCKQLAASHATWTDDDIKELTRIFMGPGSVWQCAGLPIPYDYASLSPVIVPPIKLVNSVWTDNWPEETRNERIDLLPFIAYGKLYDEFFRDQTLCPPLFQEDEDFGNFSSSWSYKVNLTNNHGFTLTTQLNVNVFNGGPYSFGSVAPLFVAFRRAWQKDYYTSATPTPQRGPEVSLDMFSDKKVPVSVEGSGALTMRFQNTAPGDEFLNDNYVFSTQSTEQEGFETKLQSLDDHDVPHDIAVKSIDGLKADLTGLSPITIAAFRNLFKLQAFLEKNNVAGGRFIEFILAHWAERIPDFTVQRPVFVRATTLPVIVSEVTATANSDGLNSVVGDQAGRAKGQGNLGKCRIYTQEPSIIIGIYCVCPPPAYVTQGIPKKFQRFTRWDEPYAEFQHIGEQAILNKEIFIPWTTLQQGESVESEFGYQQRYSEFKYLPDRVIGEMATNLAYWHQARIFTKMPALNKTFIENSPSDRIFAVENQMPVIADFWFDINCNRKLSKFSTPKLS